MDQEEAIDLSILDGKEIKKLEEKQKKIDRVIELIHENGLEKNKEFMEEIEEVIEALKQEK